MKKIPTALKIVGFLMFGLAILWFVFQNEAKKFDGNLIEKILADSKTFNLWWLVLALSLYVLSNFSRASRWKMLLNSMGYNVKWSNAFWTVMVGYLTNLGLPRAGELAKALSLSQYEKVPFEKVMGTVVVDRVLDLISFGIMFLLGLCVSFDLLFNYISENGQLPIEKLAILGVIGLLGAAFLAFLFRSERFADNFLVKKIRSFMSGIMEGIMTVSKLENPGLFIFHSVAIWVLYYLMTYLAFFAFEPTSHVSPEAGLIVFILGSLGMIIPSPGGMGSYQYFMMTGLGLYGVNSTDGFSFAMIWFLAVNILINLVLGLIALVVLPISNANYHPAHTKQTPSDD